MDPNALAVLRLQHGVITRAQALGNGVTKHELRRWLGSNEWEAVYPGVYRHRAVEASWAAELVAACLHAGGIASHRAAARLHGLEEFAGAGLELSVAHGRFRSVVGVTLHQSTQLELAQSLVRDGVPCTGLARTVLDVGAVVSRRRLENLIDEVIRTKRLRWWDLYGVLAAHSRRGRNGCGPLRSILDERHGDERVPLSSWSRMLADLLVQHRLPEPRLEYRVEDPAGSLVAQVDLAYPASRVAIELDSVRWHHDRDSFERDRARIRRLATVGWTVLPLTWAQYVGEGATFADEVRSVLSRS